MHKIEYAAASSVGNVRENNEDNYFADGEVLAGEGAASGITGSYGLFAVCDGMGGAEYGEIAAKVSVRVLGAYYDNITSGNNFGEICNAYVDEVNKKLCDEMDKREGVRIGTTLALLSVADGEAQI